MGPNNNFSAYRSARIRLKHIFASSVSVVNEPSLPIGILGLVKLGLGRGPDLKSNPFTMKKGLSF